MRILKVGDLVEWRHPYIKTASPELGIVMSQTDYSNGKTMYTLFSRNFKNQWGAWPEEIRLISGGDSEIQSR